MRHEKGAMAWAQIIEDAASNGPRVLSKSLAGLHGAGAFLRSLRFPGNKFPAVFVAAPFTYVSL